MEKEKLEGLLIEYIDNNLTESQRKEVELMLTTDKDANQLFNELKEVMGLMDNSKDLAPLTGHEEIFKQHLKEKISHPQEKQIFFTPVIYRVAAGVALLMVGLAGGYWINENNKHEQELAALRKEMVETKQMMMAMIGNDQSASQRMQGVNVALNISKADDDVVNALAKAMTTDPNTNVRLAALEALWKFIDDPNVRKILTGSLSKQDDPVVQIALIQMLVRMKEKNIVNDLEQIIGDDKNIQAVKDAAYTGILKLS